MKTCTYTHIHFHIYYVLAILFASNVSLKYVRYISAYIKKIELKCLVVLKLWSITYVELENTMLNHSHGGFDCYLITPINLLHRNCYHTNIFSTYIYLAKNTIIRVFALRDCVTTHNNICNYVAKA